MSCRLVASAVSADGEHDADETAILEAEAAVEMVGCTELLDALGRVVEEHGQETMAFITA